MDYNRLADRYIASWNADDPAERRKIIDEIWAEDGTYVNRVFAVQGRDYIDFAVGRAHAEYAQKGFSFRSQGNAYGHHNGFKFGWVMVDERGEVDTYGEDFMLVDDNGQITVDYQFAMKRPSV
ncbi:hypothetical protein [Longispora albida]|uniref:hypothetical protein n=1 Tax=Longispora albida TaxID=203523 RepID=UPI0003813486|nr:hypothetical protein [Longispora albida]